MRRSISSPVLGRRGIIAGSGRSTSRATRSSRSSSRRSSRRSRRTLTCTSKAGSCSSPRRWASTTTRRSWADRCAFSDRDSDTGTRTVAALRAQSQVSLNCPSAQQRDRYLAGLRQLGEYVSSECIREDVVPMRAETSASGGVRRRCCVGSVQLSRIEYTRDPGLDETLSRASPPAASLDARELSEKACTLVHERERVLRGGDVPRGVPRWPRRTRAETERRDAQCDVRVSP